MVVSVVRSVLTFVATAIAVAHAQLLLKPPYLEAKDKQILGAAATLSMLSPIVGQVGKITYDDVEADRTSVRSLVEKCTYDDLEENPFSTPTEDSDFLDKNS